METDAEEPLQRKTSRNKEAEAAITLVGEKRSSHSCKEASKQASKQASKPQATRKQCTKGNGTTGRYDVREKMQEIIVLCKECVGFW